jgi:uncharacterized protein
MLTFQQYSSADAFLQDVGEILEQNETEHSLILGLARVVQQSPERFPSVLLARVAYNEATQLAAMMIEPNNLLIGSTSNTLTSRDALNTLISGLEGHKLPGVEGRINVAEAFAQMWKPQGSLHMKLRIYALEQVIPPSGYDAGTLRLATLGSAFEREALGGDVSAEEAEERAKRIIGNQNLFLWHIPAHDAPVSMAARARPTAHGCTVNFVYTPPEHRGHGYASACVARLSQHLLDSGFKFCTLFTDLGNPTSNSIYQRIGYTPICDWNKYRFDI